MPSIIRMISLWFCLVLVVQPDHVSAVERPVRTIRLETAYPVVDLLKRRPIKRPRIGLALSGGGARGFTHIGVLKVLHNAGIPVFDRRRY